MKRGGKPCEFVELRLLSLESTRQDGRTITFEHQRKRIGAKRATAQHICSTADYSYIRGDALCELVRANCGPDAPGIEITDDTVAVLEWRYLKAKKTETTRHLAVQESPADITFRVDDWEEPVRAMVQQVLQEEKSLEEKPLLEKPLEEGKPRERAVSRVSETKRSRDEAKGAGLLHHQTFSDHGMDTDCETNHSYDSPEPSRRSSASSVPSEHHGPNTTWDLGCTRPPLPSQDDAGGEGSEAGSATTLEAPRRSYEDQIDTISSHCESPMETEGGCEGVADKVGEMDWAGIQIELVDVPQEDVFWDWSTKEGRWYHRDPDGHIRSWFPETIESS